MRLEQLKTLSRSLRFRLTFWNTAVVLLSVIVTLVGVREALRLTLIHEMDQLLLDDTSEVSLAVEQLHPDLQQIFNEMDRKVEGHRDRDLFVQLLAPGGEVVWSSRNAPPLAGVPLPARNRPATRDVGDYRLAQRKLSRKGVPEYTIRVGSSLAMVDDDVSKLTRLMTVAGMVVLLVAPLGGYWLAGRATSPLGRIITTAARLRPSHMEERLPMRGAGDQLDQLSQTINRFLDLIAEYLERNREFVANAAHELRSPLAAIQSSVEVTLNSDRTIAEYQDQLYEIADQCGHLGVLVNQLLLLAETDARFQTEKLPVYLDRLLDKSLDMFRGAAEERGIQLLAESDRDVLVDADGHRLRQVINNLIDNSLKFTPRGGHVNVRLKDNSAAGHIELSVADSGMGIAPEDLPHVFERFYRGDKSRGRDDRVGGNGLGLSICQSIVAAHGGLIQVESTPGRGAKFMVRLPAAVNRSAPLAPAHVTRSGPL